MPALNPGYCGSTGTFTLSGQFRHGSSIMIPHENCPLTLFVKRCSAPQLEPCAHQAAAPPGMGPVPVGAGGGYCSDGTLETVSIETDCSGSYSVTVSGCVLAVALAIGSWIPNPAFSCSAPPASADPGGDAWLPFIPDPATVGRFGCPMDIGASGTALTIGQLFNDETGGITDASAVNGACGYIVPGQECLPCSATTGSFYVTSPTAVTISLAPDGTLQRQPQALSGSYTLDFWNNFYTAGIIAYYTLDGQYYMVGGVNVHLTDACGLTETLASSSYPAAAQIAVVDWANITSATISNWPADCSPPLYTTFSGPEGPLFVSGPLTGPPGPQLPAITCQLYPAMADLTKLCIGSFPVFGVLLQTCTGAQPERLQADMLDNVLALSWIESPGGALRTAVHRSPGRQIGSSTMGWEPTQTVESDSADDIGMVFLPNESLYLTYLQSGSPVYRLNMQRGAGAAWGAASAASVARHSAGGRGEGQAFRLRALGTAAANGSLEFSQCRDNRGAGWTGPVVVTAAAQGPWCGGIFVENAYICLYSLAQAVEGLAAAGSICLARSVDGGLTWALSYTGFSGQVGGIARTRQGVLAATVLSGTAVGAGTYGVGWLISRNNGQGWSNATGAAASVPAMALPPVIAAQEDTLFTVWVSGGQPQFAASRDGGVTWV